MNSIKIKIKRIEIHVVLVSNMIDNIIFNIDYNLFIKKQEQKKEETKLLYEAYDILKVLEQTWTVPAMIRRDLVDSTNLLLQKVRMIKRKTLRAYRIGATTCNKVVICDCAFRNNRSYVADDNRFNNCW